MSETKPYGILKLRDMWVVAEATRKSMQGNRSTGTKPEERLRLALWHAGLRGYRKNVKRLPGKPDVVFGRARLVVFVHGCFWHGCPSCTRNRSPRTNEAYWREKIRLNQVRDAENEAKLREMGYEVLVIWECGLKTGLEAFVAAVRGRLANDGHA